MALVPPNNFDLMRKGRISRRAVALARDIFSSHCDNHTPREHSCRPSWVLAPMTIGYVGFTIEPSRGFHSK
jgi:hypothetical protein